MRYSQFQKKYKSTNNSLHVQDKTQQQQLGVGQNNDYFSRTTTNITPQKSQFNPIFSKNYYQNQEQKKTVYKVKKSKISEIFDQIVEENRVKIQKKIEQKLIKQQQLNLELEQKQKLEQEKQEKENQLKISNFPINQQQNNFPKQKQKQQQQQQNYHIDRNLPNSRLNSKNDKSLNITKSKNSGTVSHSISIDKHKQSSSFLKENEIEQKQQAFLEEKLQEELNKENKLDKVFGSNKKLDISIDSQNQQQKQKQQNFVNVHQQNNKENNNNIISQNLEASRMTQKQKSLIKSKRMSHSKSQNNILLHISLAHSQSQQDMNFTKSMMLNDKLNNNNLLINHNNNEQNIVNRPKSSSKVSNRLSFNNIDQSIQMATSQAFATNKKRGSGNLLQIANSAALPKSNFQNMQQNQNNVSMNRSSQILNKSRKSSRGTRKSGQQSNNPNTAGLDQSQMSKQMGKSQQKKYMDYHSLHQNKQVQFSNTTQELNQKKFIHDYSSEKENKSSSALKKSKYRKSQSQQQNSQRYFDSQPVHKAYNEVLKQMEENNKTARNRYEIGNNDFILNIRDQQKIMNNSIDENFLKKNVKEKPSMLQYPQLIKYQTEEQGNEPQIIIDGCSSSKNINSQQEIQSQIYDKYSQKNKNPIMSKNINKWQQQYAIPEENTPREFQIKMPQNSLQQQINYFHGEQYKNQINLAKQKLNKKQQSHGNINLNDTGSENQGNDSARSKTPNSSNNSSHLINTKNKNKQQFGFIQNNNKNLSKFSKVNNINRPSFMSQDISNFGKSRVSIFNKGQFKQNTLTGRQSVIVKFTKKGDKNLQEFYSLLFEPQIPKLTGIIQDDKSIQLYCDLQYNEYDKIIEQYVEIIKATFQKSPIYE